MADSRFPLFRLPFLALCRVLDFYGPQEIIRLSICSKRSLRVAKKCWKKKGVVKAHLHAKKTTSVNLYFFDSGACYHYYQFAISKSVDLQEQKVHNVRIGDAVGPSIHKKTETVTYWGDKIFGIEQVVRYINDLFDAPITSIDLKSEGYENELIDTINCIMKVQESFQDCTLHAEDSTDECLAYLLNSCKITGELSIYGEPTRQFKNDWNIHLDSIYISNGLCLTFQNLTNIDCQSLCIGQSSLTSQNLNQFLKNWQNGGNSRIRCARIALNFMNNEVVTSGIETVQQPETVQRCYPCARNHTVMKRGGLDIKRNDGTIGTIYLSGILFGFGVGPIDGSI
ncbi:unnamed protein product [Caenorhabditis brenneri]